MASAIKQLSLALIYMHNLTPLMIHSDVKPEDTLESRCEFTVSFGRVFTVIRVETSRIAANSQRFRATVWLHVFSSRFHRDSLRLGVEGETQLCNLIRLSPKQAVPFRW